MSTELSLRLAEYVHDLRYEQIAPSAIERAKHHLVHHLGLAIGSGSTEAGRQAVRVARMLSGADDTCTIIGAGLRASPIDAAFANTTLMRADGLDDVLFPVGVHAGLMTLPTALAVGEQFRLPGRLLLTAIVAGYDLIGKLGGPVWSWSAATPRRPTIAFGPFGAVAVAAKLLGLDVAQTAHAIGYGAHSAMGLAEGDLVTHYYGLVVRNGLLGTLLAREGGQAAPTVLEGRFGFFRTFFGEIPAGLEESLDTLGKTFEIENATVKRYPGTALNIVPIELMIELTRANRLTPADVSQIEIALPAERTNFAEGHSTGPFRSRANASSSVAFQVAMVLLDGGVNLARYDDFDGEQIRGVLDRVAVELVPDRPIRYAKLRITTTDGRQLIAERHDHTFPRSEWLPWLTERGSGSVAEDRLRRIVDFVSRLEEVDDVAELMRCLA